MMGDDRYLTDADRVMMRTIASPSKRRNDYPVIPEAAVEAAACPSSIHAKHPRPATDWGTFNNPANDEPARRVKYCRLCALTAEALGMFVIEEGEAK